MIVFDDGRFAAATDIELLDTALVWNTIAVTAECPIERRVAADVAELATAELRSRS